MLRYIPAHFRNYLGCYFNSDADLDMLWRENVKQGNNFRTLTVMAINLELDRAFENEDSLNVLQTTIEIIQKQIYKQRGSISKIFFNGTFSKVSNMPPPGTSTGEGGLQIIVEWGHNFLNNIDNPARACISALNIQRAVKEFIMMAQIDLGSTVSDFEMSKDQTKDITDFSLNSSM